uniref:Glycosyl transferase family 28 C-terminal domain-containing protein n=1 Tax=Oryza punctata TaxID=4537 RepID=A0A0E0JZN4_ORYPU
MVAPRERALVVVYRGVVEYSSIFPFPGVKERIYRLVSSAPCAISRLNRGGRGADLHLASRAGEGILMGDRERRTVFVTVGTTCFDALVKTVDSPQVKEALLQKGYTDLVIQMGRGDGTLQVDYFTFSPSIADYIWHASLVISHAGSGSIFETLRHSKPLIVVVNEDLMDNHQSELAEELATRRHLFCARPQTLGETIQEMDIGTLTPYVPGDAKPVVSLINKFLGFPDD